MKSFQYPVFGVQSDGMSANETGGFARSFTDLVVYQKARRLSREVFAITKRLPKEEAYALTVQWRRAARSVGAQIAEAWAKRLYPKHFTSKLTDADGEQAETQHWILVAFDDAYITREEAHALGSLCQEIGRMLGTMMQKAESFRGDQYSSRIREEPEFWADPDEPAAETPRS